MATQPARADSQRWPRALRAIPRLILAVVASLMIGAPITARATTAPPKAQIRGKTAAKRETKTATKTPTKTATKTPTKAATRHATRTTAKVATSPNAKGKTKGAAKTNAKTSRSAAETKPPAPIPNPKGKVAVFSFTLDGERDGAAPLRTRVVRLLRARGLKVTTTLRPVDSAEQYREMADTLDLAAFLDGEVSEDGDQASVTIHVRSGVSGLRVASATLSGERRKMAGEVDRSLWTQLGPPLARVCTEAAKPRKREREPMRIEAGTPLDAPPTDPKGDAKKGT